MAVTIQDTTQRIILSGFQCHLQDETGHESGNLDEKSGGVFLRNRVGCPAHLHAGKRCEASQ